MKPKGPEEAAGGGTINFRHDIESDIVVAVPHWRIETRGDLVMWFGQYEAYMKQFDRKMDIILVLDDFVIGSAIGPSWGEYRAKVHQRFTRFSYTVHRNNRVRLFSNTSGVRYNIDTREAATIDDAIEGIKAARRAAR